MARVLLTDTRSRWIREREHSGAIKGDRLANPAGVADRYARKLQKLADEMTATTKREITELYAHPDFTAYFEKKNAAVSFAMDVSPASQARILTNDLKNRFDALFRAVAPELAAGMVDQANDASEVAMAQSLKTLSGGLKLTTDLLTGTMNEFLKASVASNVSLIKSIPSEFFTDVQGAVLRSITDGKGLDDLTKFFETQEGVQSRRAKNIAIDQTHKAYGGLNAERMKRVGIGKYEWRHSGGGLHPRPLHQSYAGRIFSFDKPPVIDEHTGERGIPGQAINCRCTMVPVVKFEDGKPE